MRFVHSVSGDLFAFPFTAPFSFLSRAWEGARDCGEDRVPVWVPKSGGNFDRPDGAVTHSRVEGEAAVLPGSRGGQQRGQRQVREPLPE